MYEMHFIQKLFSTTHGHCVLVNKRITRIFDVTDDSKTPVTSVPAYNYPMCTMG